MYNPSPIYFVVLTIALSLLVAQLFVQKKDTLHVLFAIFCASIALTVTKELSGDSIGNFQYLVGMGACATCNVYWLISRTLFRDKNPFSAQHLMLAAAIAALIMVRQGHLLMDSVWGMTDSVNQVVTGIVVELTIMLSAFILIMSGWEAIRNFSQVSRQQKVLRLTFLMSFLGAVALSKLATIVKPEQPEFREFVVACVMISILVVTQFVINWQLKLRHQQSAKVDEPEPLTPATELPLSKSSLSPPPSLKEDTREDDEALTAQIQTILIEQKLFLQANLKVADVARELDEPEYKVSRVLRRHFEAKNFNQFVNELRIEYAKALLTDTEKQKWPVLVVGLESGFASVGPFTRAFKAITGFTPNQYRKTHCH